MLVCTVEPATTDDIPALFGQSSTNTHFPPSFSSHSVFLVEGKTPISSFSVVVVVVFVEVASALRY